MEKTIRLIFNSDIRIQDIVDDMRQYRYAIDNSCENCCQNSLPSQAPSILADSFLCNYKQVDGCGDDKTYGNKSENERGGRSDVFPCTR